MPMPHRVAITSWQEAEHNAAAWMRYWGFRDAVAHPGGSDGGIDVRSSRAAAQVKYQAAHVGRPDIQRLYGAGGWEHHLQLLMFTGTRFTPEAVAYAEMMGIALFIYALDGTMTPVNGVANDIATGAPMHGIRESFPGAAYAPSVTPSMPSASPTGSPQYSLPARSTRRIWPRVLMYFFSFAFFLSPFQSFSDPDFYAGSFIEDAFQFLFVLIVSWSLAWFLFAKAQAYSRR